MRRTAPSGFRRAFSLAVVAVLVLSTVAPAALAASPAPAALADSGASDPPRQVGPDDPDDDVIGWENGYWHNESIDVDQSDGLDDGETEAFVARSMARVEYIRDAEFDEEVPVEVISREEYRNTSGSAGSSDENRTAFNHWNDQVWEGLFIVGESTESSAAIGQTTGSSVAGFYSPSDDEIKIITTNPDTPVIDNATLVHELVHALQDQRYDLTKPVYRSDTQDGDLGIDGVIEGEANYIEANYSQRCGEEWSCVPRSTSSGGGSSNLNLGVYLTIYNPYSDGPPYVHDIVESEGWDGFAERFRNPPLSSEQIIHRIDEEPVPIAFNSTARDGWEIYPEQGVNGSDTVGEASIFSMFWYQAREYGADTVDPRAFMETNSRYDTYNYDAAPSAGWANDRLFPYHNGTGETAEYGYVWKTEWDTETDANEFYDAYLRMLDAHEVERTSEGYYRIPDGQFADTFAVVRNGTTVTVVNGPDAAAVSDIRPSIREAVEPVETANATTDSPGTTDAAAGGDTATDERTTGTTETGAAGFGFVVAVAAVIVAGLLARFRD